MKIYDISQEIFTSAVFPGDPCPKREAVCEIDNGNICNLTAFSMCAHNGTHIDAPYHFINDGKTVDRLDINKLVGYAYVSEQSGIITKEKAGQIYEKAKSINEDSAQRLLIKGNASFSYEAGELLASKGVCLLGNESQTVGKGEEVVPLHKLLLSREIVLLEGIRLSSVPEGVYLLNAAPINLGGSDGAPCRALLIEIK